MYKKNKATTSTPANNYQNDNGGEFMKQTHKRNIRYFAMRCAKCVKICVVNAKNKKKKEKSKVKY